MDSMAKNSVFVKNVGEKIERVGSLVDDAYSYMFLCRLYVYMLKSRASKHYIIYKMLQFSCVEFY